jgi:hypothetical protein
MMLVLDIRPHGGDKHDIFHNLEVLQQINLKI